MLLLDEYASDFAKDVRQRGRELFRRKAVKLVDSEDISVIDATVKEASDIYPATIGWDIEEGRVYECSCAEYLQTGNPCRHCWATVLQADNEGILPSEEDAIDAETESLVRFRSPIDPSRRNHGKTEVRGSRAEDPDAWKRQLKQLTQQMKAHPTLTPPAPAWPPGRRILYLVDKTATMEGRGLIIELAQETPKKDGAYDRPKQLKVGREQVASLPDPVDRQILQMLLGARRGDWGYYGYYDTESPKRFELPESAYLTTLREMCDTGRCRLRRQQGDDHPTPLRWDDGPAWEFWLEVKPSPGGRYLILDASLRRPVPTGANGSPAHSNGDGLDEHANAQATDGENGQSDSAAPGTDEAAAQSADDAPSGEGIAPHTPQERMTMGEADLLVRGGLVFAHGRVARLEDFDAFDLIIALRSGLKLSVPLAQSNDLLKTLFALPRLPRLDLPEDLKLEEARPAPRPRLTIKKLPKAAYDDRLVGSVAFDYGGKIVSQAEDANAVLIPEDRRVLYRDARRESEFLGRLLQLGFREAWDYSYNTNRPALRLPQTKLPKVVAELTREGWHVEAEGKLYRQPGELKIDVKSGIDWFELHGEVSFGDVSAPLPRLLAALRRGENSVRLDDGTFGLLPQEWLKKYAGLAGMGEEEGDHLRFHKRQVGFLDALLSSMPEARFDETFARARDELMRFSGIEPLDAPKGFQGALRAYQRDGLGWMSFLRKFGFGGVLADDMGLGKTVQVLALLEGRRQMRHAGTNGNGDGKANGDGANGNGAAGAPANPPTISLVVAPRSLVFNWKQEAARFCPDLRVLDHTSVGRARDAETFANYDLILTTYGTLRRDMAFLKDVRFDYAVLDEAQAIKNASSESAKAARLLVADHRLALSGTPVQNHLGELWSLFEFLNPGMMGSAAVFKDLTGSAAANDPAAREVLAKALRPFVLRRTKEQVAKDLPEKLEQTVFCELETEQRRVYNELRDYYRTSLLERIAREGMNKAKIQVLEALLRLRQAACHPGLIDKAKSKEGSAKLDALMGQLADVMDEGHKVLVFSQFTSFLAIVRQRLDAQKTVYEYLDGKTRDRQARVERFQSDPDCKLFLISLKAGGLGLNLTAAEYVFLLDPWWNPAVEAQAIDRAHRIGQMQKVFAYRLIAKDTVEEKVLQLQQSKKDLADAIINADNSLIRTLKRDDLELLLS